MVPSARQAIACVLFIFVAAVCSKAQVAPAKNSTATISGKVTLKTKGTEIELKPCQNLVDYSLKLDRR